MRRSLARQMLGATGGLALLIAGVFLLMVRAIGDERKAADAANRAQSVIAIAADLERVVIHGLDDGTRDFLISGHERDLKPYNEAIGAYPGLLLRLEAFVHGGLRRDAKLIQVNEIQDQLQSYINDYLRPTIALARRDIVAARRHNQPAGEVRRTTALENLLSTLVAGERQEAAIARPRADRSANRALILGISGTAGTLLLLTAFALYLRRSVLRPARRVAVAAERIGAGDLSARAVGADAAGNELQRMKHAFNEMADSVERARDAMLEAERAKDQFLAVTSHELRTPLTSILGYLDLMIEGGPQRLSSDQGVKFLEIMNRNSRRLLRLVGDVLFVAQMGAGRATFEYTDIDLSEIVRESVDAFKERAGHEGIELRSEIAEMGKTCWGDRGRLGQAIDNLISNAVKFTPHGGTVTVSLRPDGADRMTIEVADTGSGVPKAEQARLFEDFYRASTATRDAVQGSGLGLGIVKTIVVAHDGEIELESEEGKGTKVRISLPLGPREPTAAVAERAVAEG